VAADEYRSLKETVYLLQSPGNAAASTTNTDSSTPLRTTELVIVQARYQY
jgi:PHD/YefM family antitoxin component YafN of YafNO toxin-antitoxin module